MAISTTTPTETTFGCDLMVRALLCSGAADTVVAASAGPAFACRACAEAAAEHAEIVASPAAGEPSF